MIKSFEYIFSKLYLQVLSACCLLQKTSTSEKQSVNGSVKTKVEDGQKEAKDLAAAAAAKKEKEKAKKQKLKAAKQAGFDASQSGKASKGKGLDIDDQEDETGEVYGQLI